MGVKNMSDLVLKEMRGIFGTKKTSKEQIQKYKITEREIFETYDNLSKDELNTRNNKHAFVKNPVMTTVTKRCTGDKKRRKKIDDFRKNLMIPEFEIPEYIAFEVKSKSGNIFVNEKNTWRIFCYDLWNWSFFYEYDKTKIKVHKNGHKYILFKIDVHFTEYFLAVQIDEKGHKDRELIFEEKRQKQLEIKLGCEFIRINTSTYYDDNYEIGETQIFICKSKDKQLKKIKKRIKQKIKKIRRRIKQKNRRTRRQNKKIKTSIAKSNHPTKTKSSK